MFEVAKDDPQVYELPESRVKYFLGNVIDPDLVIPSGPCDIVTSSWLLN